MSNIEEKRVIVLSFFATKITVGEVTTVYKFSLIKRGQGSYMYIN
jgi:hypothetical protein